jgi:hypothetical protein
LCLLAFCSEGSLTVRNPNQSKEIVKKSIRTLKLAALTALEEEIGTVRAISTCNFQREDVNLANGKQESSNQVTQMSFAITKK